MPPLLCHPLRFTPDYTTSAAFTPLLIATQSLEGEGQDGGDVSFFLYDGLGSTRSLTNSDGELTQTYNYHPFGQGINHPGELSTNHLFTGEYFDQDLSYYYLRARYYTPTLGRFTSLDPAEDVNNKLHKYVYCGNDGNNHIDPNGDLSWYTVFIAFVNWLIGKIIVSSTGFNKTQCAWGPERLIDPPNIINYQKSEMRFIDDLVSNVTPGENNKNKKYFEKLTKIIEDEYEDRIIKANRGNNQIWVIHRKEHLVNYGSLLYEANTFEMLMYGYTGAKLGFSESYMHDLRSGLFFGPSLIEKGFIGLGISCAGGYNSLSLFFEAGYGYKGQSGCREFGYEFFNLDPPVSVAKDLPKYSE